MGVRPGCYVDTCLLVSLFLQDEGYAAAEHWLAGSAGDALWVSHWVLLEFAAAVGLRLRRGDLEPRRPQSEPSSGLRSGAALHLALASRSAGDPGSARDLNDPERASPLCAAYPVPAWRNSLPIISSIGGSLTSRSQTAKSASSRATLSVSRSRGTSRRTSLPSWLCRVP